MVPPSLFCASRHLLLTCLDLCCSPSSIFQSLPDRKGLELLILPSIIHLPAEFITVAKWDETMSFPLDICSCAHCSSLGHRNRTALFFHGLVPNFPQNISILPWELWIQRHTLSHTCISMLMECYVCSLPISGTHPVSEKHLWTPSLGNYSLFIPVQVGTSHPCLLVFPPPL